MYINGPDRVNQIDHIFVMRTGIFLVEAKMFYYGRVIGKDDEEIWVNKVEDRVTPFLNPIIQNESHESALRKLIGDKYKIIPLVVFAWNNKPRSTTDPYVLNYKEFVNFPIDYKGENELSDEDINYICDLLNENNKNKTELKKKHKEQLMRQNKNLH